MSRLFTILTVAGLVVLLAVPAVAWAVGPEECVRPVYHIDRSSYAVTTPDNYAYMSEGVCLTVLDVADPSRPIVLERTPKPNQSGIGTSITTLGGYAYLTAYSVDVVTFNVSDPTHPFEAKYQNLVGDRYENALLGRYLYVGGPHDGVAVLDLSDPVNPIEAGELPGGTFINMSIDNHHLYSAHGDLDVWSLTNPVTPTAIASYPLSDGANDLFITDDMAYIPYGSTFKYSQWGGLQLVDVSDPISPTLAGTYDLGMPALASVAYGSYAYITTAGLGQDYKLNVLNISNPTSPTLVTCRTLTFAGTALDLAGPYLYIIGRRGLRVMDVSNPASPTLIGAYQTSFDVNEDNAINVVDLQSIATQLNQTTINLELQLLDIDGSGTVDIQDLMLAASNWRSLP